MSAELAANHLRMINAIQASLEAHLDDMHDQMDRSTEAVDDDEPVRHVLSALLTVAHNYFQSRSATDTPGDLAFQYLASVNQVATDLASAYFDAGVKADPLTPMERMQ